MGELTLNCIVKSILNTICKTSNHHSRVKSIILLCKECLDEGTSYDYQRKPVNKSKQRKIQMGSDAEKILASYKKISSFGVSTDILNVLVRHPAAESPLGVTSVYNAVKRMKHIKSKTKGVNQQNDEHGHWKSARFNYCAQILVRLGLWLPKERRGGVIYDPYYIDPMEIAIFELTFALNQVAFWDEIHMDVVIGQIMDECLTFACDENGVYSVDGVFIEEAKVSLIL